MRTFEFLLVQVCDHIGIPKIQQIIVEPKKTIIWLIVIE